MASTVSQALSGWLTVTDRHAGKMEMGIFLIPCLIVRREGYVFIIVLFQILTRQISCHPQILTDTRMIQSFWWTNQMLSFEAVLKLEGRQRGPPSWHDLQIGNLGKALRCDGGCLDQTKRFTSQYRNILPFGGDDPMPADTSLHTPPP
jgi:hypothetical protein